MPLRPVAILCNPGTRRVSEHAEALARLSAEPPVLVPYASVLGGVSIGDLLPPRALLRIETWGDDPGVEGLLVERGGGDPERRQEAEGEYGRYRWQLPVRWGVESLLAEVEGVLAQRPDVRALNAPAEILTMSDKARCRDVLLGGDVPVPPGLLGGVPVADFDELKEIMDLFGWGQVFVKPNLGSSAAGVIALRISGERAVSYSTLELVEEGGTDRFYNSLKVRRETSRDRVERLLRQALLEGAVVERWIPKRSHPRTGKAMDFRVVCVGGEPMHSVIRTSAGPITNLHLGNARESFEEFAAEFPRAAECVRDAAGAAAALFPGSVTASVDVLLERGRDRAWVLEVNAFGELLHGVTVDGATPYDALWRHVFGWA